MVLEATMLVLDNSEWMRNGDYTPCRFEAQNDAVNLLFSAKTQSHPESTVGVMTMAGKVPEVLVTFTNNLGEVLQALHTVKLSGNNNMSHAIQVAHLALKHRQNKNQRQRIVVFVGSPLADDEKTLTKLGKKLKKNNVAVDIVNFGEHEANTSKLEAFTEAVNNSDNSHLLTVTPGPHILSDALISSAIVQGEDGAPAGLAGSGGGAFEFGVDPNLDPELALALRISMEEERARQGASDKKDDGVAPMSVDKSAHKTEDDVLAQAIAMSMGASGDGDVEMADEDEELARAIAMSTETASSSSAKPNKTPSGATDPAFMTNLLGSLPGVDPNDPRIKNALQQKDTKDKKDGSKSPEKKK